MKNYTYLIAFLAWILFPATMHAQDTNAVQGFQSSLESRTKSKAHFGMYGQLDYNQPFGNGTRYNGTLDVHRLVGFIGYKFSDKLSFMSEIEVEHVKEIYIEQAVINYSFSDLFNFRGGLVLIPMGIINEYHEPPTFNGVERPNLDNKIVPTTWRELGAGLFGKSNSASIKYQLYVVNGFASYDGKPKLKGESLLRSGRQKGVESLMSSPALAAKIEHYGINGLKVGLSYYAGKTQSSLYNEMDTDNPTAAMRADSSVVGVRMLGADARFKRKGLEARAQANYLIIDGAGKYNAFAQTDLATEAMGYYIELGYDWLRLCHKKRNTARLVTFARFEKYNTHHSVPEGTDINPAYNRTDLTFGITFMPLEQVAFKVDYQQKSNALDKTPANQLNIGLGFWFY